MSTRSAGVTALSLLATVQGIYALVMAIALLFGGTLGAYVGVQGGTTTMVLGAIFLAISAVSFGVGAGFWTRKSWAWTAGLVVYVVWIVANLATVLVGANLFSVLMPVVLGAAVVWFLLQPRTREELLGPGSSPATREPDPTTF